MNLLDYLDLPNNLELSSAKFSEGFLGSSICKFSGNENISDFQVGIIGLDDTRNSFPNKVEFNPNKVRSYLYSLVGFSKLSIIDFGNFKRGKTIDDTYFSIKQVIEFLVTKGVVIILIGGTQEISVPISETLYKNQKHLELTFVDALIDSIDESDFHSKSYLLNRIFTKKGRVVKSIFGFQSYLASQNILTQMKSKGYNLFRLGSIRNNFQSIEPILRDTDFLSFDLSSVRQSDSPVSDFKSPNGFYAEEACQLTNIGGLSDKIKILNISGIDTKNDESGQSTHLMAQIIWHFILGLSNRTGEYPIQSLSAYKKIYVSSEKLSHEFIFYKNEKNNRFWVELPKNNNKEVEVIACAESDYTAVCNNEIPERIWKRISNAMK